MDARTQIADILYAHDLGYLDTQCTPAADAILASLTEILRADPSILRGMVKPLDLGSDDCPYDLFVHRGDKFLLVFFSGIESRELGVFDNMEAAQAAANEHHISTVLADMGVV